MKKIFTFFVAVLATASLMAKQTVVAPGEKVMATAFSAASAGDTLLLQSGTYKESSALTFDKAITLMAEEGAKPFLKINKIVISAPAEFNGLEITNLGDDYMLRTGGNIDGTFAVKNCFMNSSITAFIYLSSNSVTNLVIDNCIFGDNTKGQGGIVYAEAATVTNFSMTNCTAYNIFGELAVWLQGCENAYVDYCTFYECGTRNLYIKGTTMTDYLVQNSIFSLASAPEENNYCIATYAGDVKNCMYNNLNAPRSSSATITKCTEADPMFFDPNNGDFTLSATSPALTAGTDGGAIGDPRWAPEPGPGIVEVAPGAGTLSAAIAAAEDGDTFILSTGAYNESASIAVEKMITIIAGEDQKPVINMAGQFELMAGGFAMANVKVDGSTNTGSYFLSVRGNAAMSIWLDGCEICNYPKYFIDINTTYHIDSLIINDCYIHDIARSIVYAYTNVNEDGLPGCSYFEMTNSTVANMKGSGSSVASIYIRNNGNDAEGKNAPKIILDQVTMYSVLDPYGIITAETGAQVTVKNSIFDTSKSGRATFTLATKGAVSNCLFNNTDKGADADFTACVEADPMFVDATKANFQLYANSPAAKAGDKGQALGDPRWGVSPETALMKVAAEKKVNKMMVNGQMVIIRDGVMYNVLGVQF